jgi:hypothetical protein
VAADNIATSIKTVVVAYMKPLAYKPMELQVAVEKITGKMH